MIAHVAEAGEQRGRVVLQASSGDIAPAAVEAAMRIAAAFHAELESLFVEDDRLFDAAALPFTCQVSLCGRRREQFSPEQVGTELRHLAAALHRRIAAQAAAAQVPFKATVTRDDPVAAVVHACREHGPWNVVALAEPLTRANMDLLQRLFSERLDATGIIVVGRGAQRSTGPVVAAIDDIAHLEPALRAAEKLVAEPERSGGAIRVLLVGASEAEAHDMEDQARLLLGPESTASLVRVSPRFGSPLEDMLRNARPGFVITRFDGFLVPASGDLQAIMAMLGCPVLLMR
jgi:hypothetical protein